MGLKIGQKVMLTNYAVVTSLKHLPHRTNHVPFAIGVIADHPLNDFRGDENGAWIDVGGQIAHNCDKDFVLLGKSSIEEKFIRAQQAYFGSDFIG